MPVAPTRTVSC